MSAPRPAAPSASSNAAPAAAPGADAARAQGKAADSIPAKYLQSLHNWRKSLSGTEKANGVIMVFGSVATLASSSMALYMASQVNKSAKTAKSDAEAALKAASAAGDKAGVAAANAIIANANKATRWCTAVFVLHSLVLLLSLLVLIMGGKHVGQHSPGAAEVGTSSKLSEEEELAHIKDSVKHEHGNMSTGSTTAIGSSAMLTISGTLACLAYKQWLKLGMLPTPKHENEWKYMYDTQIALSVFGGAGIVSGIVLSSSARSVNMAHRDAVLAEAAKQASSA